MTCRFKKPVPLGEKLRLTGRIVSHRGRLFETASEATGPDGTVYATATGKYLEVPDPVLRDLL